MGMLQNVSGGTLSGDLSPKTNMFSVKNTPKIRRDPYFATLSKNFHPLATCTARRTQKRAPPITRDALLFLLFNFVLFVCFLPCAVYGTASAFVSPVLLMFSALMGMLVLMADGTRRF